MQLDRVSASMTKREKALLPLGWSLEERDPEFINSLMPYLEWLYHYYFRVKTDGWHHIPRDEKVFLVGSHNGGLAAPDMIMMMYDWFRRFGTERPVYGLTHPAIWKVYPEWARFLERIGSVIAHPKVATAAFRRGASVLVYPGGAIDVFRPYKERHQIKFAGRKGFIKLALQEEVPIIPLISVGAHETLLVLGDYYEQVKQLHEWGMPWAFNIDPEVFPIYLGLPWGLAIGPLPNIPLPARVHTRVCPPILFDRYGREAAKDRDYINECYELVRAKMQNELDTLVRDTNKN